MTCMCKLGGPICDACRQATATGERMSDLQRQLLTLAERVVRLEDLVLSQSKVIDEMAALIRSTGEP